MLLHGDPASLGAISASLFETSSRRTAIVEATASSSHLVGQFSHQPCCRSARLTFFKMDDFSRCEGLPALIDFLSYQAGESQAFNLLAEVEESSGLFEVFRRTGFSSYGVETIWRMPARTVQPGKTASAWQKASPKDELLMRSLYQNVTPPLEQSAEPYQPDAEGRLVYCSNNELTAWVHVSVGALGTYLVPVFHPSLKEPALLLEDLLDQPGVTSRPLHIQVRSHQSWLNGALEALGAQPSGQYTLLVKHLAVMQKVAATNGKRVSVDPRQANPTVPILHNLSPETQGGIKKRTKINH